ncbi:helix-turn-helix domain-containing protein [Maribacter aestuarii]|uniref:helix-turn-helix domain-containing protein n=1 Tax=Maribacter aestuarii TaxID=1130723 RepID=UPI0025A6188D|nr:helix-turn-helix domain-containing protein [Maribacter aestuarii]
MIAGAIQGFVFNIATFSSRKMLEKPILYLNLFIFFLSLNNLQSWLIDKGFLFNNDYWGHFTIPWYVLIVPMFYAFLIYYLEIESKRWPFLRLSLFIFAIELVARSIVYYLLRQGDLPQNYASFYDSLEDFVTFSYSLFLFVKAIRLIYRYQELYPKILAFDDLKWIKRFMSLGGVVFALWLLSIFWNITGIVEKPYSFYPLRLSSSLLIYWVGYQGFFRYTILKDRIVLRKEIRDRPDKFHKSDNNSYNTGANNKSAETFSKAQEYILKEQRYLDPYFSLEKLSEELNLSSSSLSKAINTNSDSNFSDFINSFRVAQVKELLASDEYSSYTIAAMGLECGFNSKSTFYSAFKKTTGITPVQYRRQRG